jgi:hypothetical protein
MLPFVNRAIPMTLLHDSPCHSAGGNIDGYLCAAEESAATIPMAHSPEQGGDEQREVLLGRLPGEKVEQSKVSAQQRHAYAL